MLRPSMHAAVLRLVALAGLTFAVVACGTADAPSSPPDASPSPAAGESPSATTTPVEVTGPSGEPVASTASIPLEELPVIEFLDAGSGEAIASLPVETPSRDEYSIGLSGRDQLEGRGMLFYYPDGASGGFWMKNTHIDLDIAFVDASQRIMEIARMEAESEDVVKPDESYEAAIEAPAGWYADHGVDAGDEVAYRFELPA